ncbi:MAG: GNAT family N-acetyltransferase [Peptococcaceae bacterium]|nr:GNAT family N-acetyltransferase [Peptococcaceae bacterium]
METFTIRLSRPEDIPALREIYNEQVLRGTATFDTEAKSMAERQEWFAMHQNPKYPLFSAVANEQVVGWGSLSPFHTRPAYAPSVEFSIYVHQAYRGQGVGALLLTQLLAEARDLGYHSILGLIAGNNEASLALADKFAMERVGRYREVGKKFGRWLDVVIVQYMLEGPAEFEVD